MPTNQTLLFVFGRTPQLSFEELRSLMPGAHRKSEHTAVAKTSVSAGDLMAQLGGTVKIARVLTNDSDIALNTLGSLLMLCAKEKQRFVFGISVYDTGSQMSRRQLQKVKEYLEQNGISSRFVEAKARTEGLSSVVVEKQHVVEFIVVKTDTGYLVAHTIAVQPFEYWNNRDYGRPYADPVAGMLPPKVSRMIVNIAAGHIEKKQPGTSVLLDPFCGMGTVLAEAASTGWTAIGSDQDRMVVDKAAQNLRWLLGNSGNMPKMFVSDATHVSEYLKNASVDAIVTEPYMGGTDIATNLIKQKDQKKIRNVVRGLEKLYIGCLREWHTVLAPGGCVVIAFPEYVVAGQSYFVKKAIDSCEKLGYTTVVGPIEYSRPEAVVKRKFYILRRGNK